MLGKRAGYGKVAMALAVFADGHEPRGHEHTCHADDVEDPTRQRRIRSVRGTLEFVGADGDQGLGHLEHQRVGIGRGNGVDRVRGSHAQRLITGDEIG